tara:strand:+ start:8063 stop:9610 length:1548 start_codon:yes stop_codon:yes gene_type:complete
MKLACVYLIGVGPGDPDLISVRALRHLKTADVVVYDSLVHRRLLRSTHPEAEQIDVSSAVSKTLKQDEINSLLVEKSRKGKTVARLMLGDPFIFGSGWQEALFLEEQGVPFEVIPSIPVSVGAPCYAGFPLTHPDTGDAILFLRGSGSETTSPPKVDWDKIASLAVTLVSYADGARIEIIIDELLKRGRSPEEPAALINQGTLPRQTTISGSLLDIQKAAREINGREPAVLVVGSVVEFGKRLSWFDSKPLFGKRILVTRPETQAADLVKRLSNLGADPIEAPMIRIEPPDDYGPLDKACELADTFDWVVFTSVNGVDSFLKRLIHGAKDIRELRGVRLCAIGPATAARLAEYGLKVDLIPPEYRGEAVAEALRGADTLSERRILLPRADIARELLPDELRRAGAKVVDVTAYRTVLAGGEKDTGPDVYKMLLDQKIDVVTFTSASTVRNFVKALGPEPAADLLNTTVVAAIGPITAEAANHLNIQTTIMPSTYTVPALIDAIVAHYVGTQSTIG